MPNFWNDIMEVLEGEDVEAIIIGDMGWEDAYREPEGWTDKFNHLQYKLLSTNEELNQAHEALSYEYDDGYGAPECHSIYVWTASRIVFVVQYDGATWITSIPRHPVACKPEMPGG